MYITEVIGYLILGIGFCYGVYLTCRVLSDEN